MYGFHNKINKYPIFLKEAGSGEMEQSPPVATALPRCLDGTQSSHVPIPRVESVKTGTADDGRVLTSHRFTDTTLIYINCLRHFLSRDVGLVPGLFICFITGQVTFLRFEIPIKKNVVHFVKKMQTSGSKFLVITN